MNAWCAVHISLTVWCNQNGSFDDPLFAPHYSAEYKLCCIQCKSSRSYLIHATDINQNNSILIDGIFPAPLCHIIHTTPITSTCCNDMTWAYHAIVFGAYVGLAWQAFHIKLKWHYWLQFKVVVNMHMKNFCGLFCLITLILQAELWYVVWYIFWGKER